VTARPTESAAPAPPAPTPPARTPPARTPLARRALTFLIRVGLAAVLVGWLIRSDRLDADLVLGLGRSGRVLLFVLLGAAGVFAGQLLLAVRLRWLLARQQLRVPYTRALGLTLIGSFFGAILPGLVSGDAVKAVYLFGDSPGARGRAVAAVLVDRFLGLYSLFLVGTVAWVGAVAAGLLPAGRTVFWIAPLVVLGMTVLSVLAGSARLARSGWMQRLALRTPERLRNLAAALHHSLRDSRLCTLAVLISLLNHGMVIVTYILAGILLQDTVTPLAHLALDPLAMVLNVVPLTPGGIGITEGAFSFLFEQVGSPHGAAVGLLGRFMQYIDYVLAGTLALVAVRFGRSGRPPAPAAG